MRSMIRISVLCGVLFGGWSAGSTAHAQSHQVRTVEVRGEGHRAEVAIRGAFDVPTYAVRSRREGRVIVIDVADASLPEGGIETTGLASLVSQAVATTTARGVRLELTMTESVTYRARSRNGRIVIRLDRAGATTAEAPARTERARQAHSTLQNVTIENRDGRDRVVVELDQAAAFRVRRTGGAQRLEIRDARLARRVRRTVAGRTDGLVRGVSVRVEDELVILEADSEANAEGTAIRSGNRIVWMFAPGERGATVRPRTRTIAREEAYEEEGEAVTGETAEVAAFLSDVPLQVRGSRGRRRYGGRRIDLDFKDADIHNILRLISEVGGVNVVTADDVAGSVTIRMRNVPWDQALDVILQAKGLGMVRRGNLIRVAPLATLEKEREAAIARRKQEVELAPLRDASRSSELRYGNRACCTCAGASDRARSRFR